MKFAINIVLYIFVALLILQNHLLLAGVVVLVFTFRCGALWLLPLAFLLDGYFGTFSAVPLISISACAWYVISEFVRPQLLLQYESYGKAS